MAKFIALFRVTGQFSLEFEADGWEAGFEKAMAELKDKGIVSVNQNDKIVRDVSPKVELRALSEAN